jgi:hypothetical protein
MKDIDDKNYENINNNTNPACDNAEFTAVIKKFGCV